nr:threonine-phosphate decarboxylase [Candidatus Solincola tengchongensis]
MSPCPPGEGSSVTEGGDGGEGGVRRLPYHGGDLVWASRRYGLPPGRFLDFSSSVNPLGPPPAALRAARAALRRAAYYPDPFSGALRRELAAWLGIGPDLLTLGNGSTELIHHLVRCRSPRRVTVVSPAFSEYRRAAEAAGCEVEEFPLSPGDGFALPMDALVSAASRSEMTFFCNPASPSGKLYSRTELLSLLEACRDAGGLLVVDESFMGFCPDRDRERATMIHLAGEEGLVIISTFTKLFALAGLRGPGWLAGTRGLVGELEEKGFPWRVNVAAEAAGRACLGDEGYLRKTRARVGAWREELARGLREAGPFRVFPGHANYLLLRLPVEGPQAVAVVEGMGRRGVLVRSCHDFSGLGEGFIRVAVRRRRENMRLLRLLRETWCEVSGRGPSRSAPVTRKVNGGPSWAS